ncbi:Chondroitin polymerase [Anaerotruncus sp. 2789STDY5834896]|uniref:Chondroitin polymerase n=1 Tax=uncultured Anaerotruncus sp. TaxID=905011 RepID=A0A1C6JE79_9FIRM|nr:Chondroitin polymerase [uncultured Anaerotruncus sp.]
MPFVSVVVPVYNIEKYLPTCIDSVVNQSYKNFELLLINDGSTDNSRAICYQYASDHAFIRVINQENSGLSAARNTGIRNATGDYIYFIDGDDLINPKALESFVEISERVPNVDYIIGRMSFFVDGTTEYIPDKWLVDPETVSGKDGQDAFASIIEVNHYFMAGIRGMYRREYLIKNRLFFDEELRYSEDIDFSYRLYRTASSVESNPLPYYYYREGRPGSLMNTLSLVKVFLTLGILTNWYQIVVDDQLSLKPRFHRALCKNLQDRFIVYYSQYPAMIERSDIPNFFEKISEYKYILRNATSVKQRLIYHSIQTIGPRLTHKVLSLYLKVKGG